MCTMALKVLSIFAAVSLFSLSSCRDGPARAFLRAATPNPRIGKQMPPHHEPDAVLINVGGGGGRPGMPGGGAPGVPFPGGPGVFGTPGGPGVFGGPGGFGFPGLPNGFGFPGTPNGFGFPGSPNGFGFPGAAPGNPGMFLPGGQNNPGFPNGPGAFHPRGQDSPAVPSGPGVSFGQGGPGFTVGTGVFGFPNGPSRPGEPAVFGQPGVFAVAGSGNVPVSGFPGFFVPGRNPSVPETPDSFPGNGGTVPETFVPGFRPGTVFPGAFFPEAPFVPNQPEAGSFPGREFYGGAGGREANDDPEAALFPFVRKTFFVSEVPS